MVGMISTRTEYSSEVSGAENNETQNSDLTKSAGIFYIGLISGDTQGSLSPCRVIVAGCKNPVGGNGRTTGGIL
jgi:hypothetical protein